MSKKFKLAVQAFQIVNQYDDYYAITAQPGIAT